MSASGGGTTAPVRHDAAAGKFSIDLDGHVAVLDYVPAPDAAAGSVMTLTHTGVPEAIGGRGIAGRLVEAAARHARGAGLRVRPACSYAAAWFGKHPEFADVLAE